ncbi:MAG: M56 family metallopeptidase [Saprospiraceae bacterium]|nr:M56 family metallopeptidase [Saprospiraceae bacterium]
MNPTKYDWDTYNLIIEHEKIHIKDKHTLDILIAELMFIIQWFNPFAWLYRKAMVNNLEYLTDLKMLKEGTDKKIYQMNLLKVSVPNLPLNLTNNYNQSILKKRILMMNAKKSSVRSSWKYLFLLPVLGLSILFLNAVKTTAQSSSNQLIEKQDRDDTKKTIYSKSIDPNDPDNDENMIIETDDAYIVAQGMTISNGEMPINGNWTAEIKNDEVCINLKSDKIQGNWWIKKDCFAKSDFTGLTNNSSSFTLEREAGITTFKGKFTGSEGKGTYSFSENVNFKSYLVSQGFISIDEKILFQFALADIYKSYIQFMRDQGYDPSIEELKSLAVHGSSKEKVKEYIDKSKKLGIEKITIKDIMQFEIHDIDMDYVMKMKDLLNQDLTAKDVVQAGIHDLSPDYIRSIKAEGYPNMTFKQIVQFGIHGIDASYIKALKTAGLTNLEPQEIVQAAIHDIDANYLKELLEAGFKDLSFKEIIQFAIHDIDDDFIKKIKDSGLDLTTQQMVQAGIHDIDANYIKELSSAGFSNMSFDEIVQFGIHDIDAEYLKELKSAGLDLNTNEIVQAAIHDISA